MDTKFISERIAKLCAEKGLSDREVSLSLGKNQSYINYITNGKAFPTMESFLDICDFFKITPSEFFDYELNNPTQTKEIYRELKRLCKNDMDKLLNLLKIMKPNDLNSVMNLLENYRIIVNQQKKT